MSVHGTKRRLVYGSSWTTATIGRREFAGVKFGIAYTEADMKLDLLRTTALTSIHVCLPVTFRPDWVSSDGRV
jgi:hypothetical protein